MVESGTVTPIAFDGAASGTAGQVMSGTLLGFDADLDRLTYVIATPPASGDLVLANPHSGLFFYTPAAGFIGDDSFTFTASDGTSTSEPATFTITVNPAPNSAPAANDMAISGAQDAVVTGTLTGSDPDGDDLTFEITSDPLSGTVALDGDTFTYTPDAGFVGDDSFTFTVSDGVLTSTPATVTLTVTGTTPTPTPTPPAPPTVTPAPGVDSGAPASGLAATGSDPVFPILFGLALLVAGAGLMFLRRRTRTIRRS